MIKKKKKTCPRGVIRGHSVKVKRWSELMPSKGAWPNDCVNACYNLRQDRPSPFGPFGHKTPQSKHVYKICCKTLCLNL